MNIKKEIENECMQCKAETIERSKKVGKGLKKQEHDFYLRYILINKTKMIEKVVWQRRNRIGQSAGNENQGTNCREE